MNGCMRQAERLVGALGEGVDWTARIKALLRLEGLAAGAAAGGLAGALPDALRPLRDPLSAQLLDRRSAVARQARLRIFMSRVLYLRCAGPAPSAGPARRPAAGVPLRGRAAGADSA